MDTRRHHALQGADVGVLGVGRFGSAFGQLLAAAGARVRGFDREPDRPDAQVPLAGSLAELCASSRFVVIATPVAAMREILDAAAPHLGGEHVVFDVGSVKVEPVRCMREVLGTRVPWAGTHPLFGPVSLALGERPLTAVLCRDARHPSAATQVGDLLTGAGCRLVERSPEDHDREMARTHALAYLIAKGVLDAGLSLDSDIAPPSARAIARTIESARADSGHLLSTLHRHNPFAAEVRRRFLEALVGADRALAETPPGAEETSTRPSGPEPRLPDLGFRSPELREVRDLIDDVDRQLIELLAQRAHLARRARKAKTALGHGVRDEHREHELLQRRRERAREMALPESEVGRVFEAILSLSRGVQESGAPDDA
jgi:prephenate dehydrogenase